MADPVITSRNQALDPLTPHGSERLWTLMRGPHRLTAELQKHRNWWEVQLSHDGVFRYAERYPTRARAIEEADACRCELKEKGWTPAKPGEDVGAIDPFEMFEWLCVSYGEVAEAPDFPLLSRFERWLLLREHVLQSRAPNARVRLDALDRLEDSLKPQLLYWLEGRRQASTNKNAERQ